MKKSGTVLCKILAAAMAVTIVGGSLASTGVGTLIGTNTKVSAAAPGAGSSPLVTIGDFDYSLRTDGTANMVGYHGKKDFSSSTLALPTVIYQSDMDVDWKNWEEYKYIGSYKITGIQAGIFSGCEIKLLSLPQELSSVFGGFTGALIGGFAIDSKNSYFSTDNGVHAIYSKDNKTLYAYPSKQTLYTTAYTGVTFNQGITRIDDQAFANCKYTSVEIPATVTYVGDRAFIGSSFSQIRFLGNAPTFRFMPDDSATDHGTFEGAASLFNIIIEGKDGKYNTYNGTVYNKDYTALVLCPQGRTTGTSFEINEACKKINQYAFYNCKKLTAITIPESVTSISTNSTFYNHNQNLVLYVTQGSYAQTWAQNNGFDSVVILTYTQNSDGTLTITGYNGKSSTLKIPGTIGGKTVTAIADSAFKDNTVSTYVTISNNVKTIGERAFSGCVKVNYVSLPTALEKIGKYAFSSTVITKVSIPLNYTSIDDYAFYNCGKLTELKFYTPLKNIGTYAFAHCKSLESVSIPKNVETLGTGCFYNCSSLSSVELGASVKTIGTFAFENTALTNQYIPSNVITIGSRSFGYTYSSDSQTHTRDNKFSYISGMPDTTAETYANNNDITFKSALTYSTGTTGVTITSYTGKETKLTLPSTIDGKPVVAIGDEAFKGASDLEAVTIPSSVKQIGSKAFYNCTSLKTISFSDGIISVGPYAFGYCTSLSSITFASSTQVISSGAFYGCSKLKYVYFNNGLYFIGQFAFANTALSSVTIPKTVTTINLHAFGYNYVSGEYVPVDSFSMTGYAYTEAENYAKDNPHITFNPRYENLVNKSTLSSSEITLGESITIYASAEGGKLPYKYYASYQYGSESYSTLIQPFSTNSEIGFTPKKAGDYTLNVVVDDDRGVQTSVRLQLTVKEAPLKNISTVSKTKLTLGEKLTVNAKGSGGKTPYLYGVYYKKASSDTWRTVQSYNSNATITVSFAAAVKYDLCVKVKDSNGKIEKKYFTITVAKPLENNSVISAETIKKGETVTVTGKAAGGISPYLYGVYYKKQTSETWSTVQSYNKNTVVTITPKAAVKYDVCVKVKDSNGKIEKKYFTLTVTK